MKIITRYILKELFLVTLLVLIALISLYAIFEMLVEGTSFGSIDQGYLVILRYIFVRLPIYMYELLPIAILMGVMIALAKFVISNEYVIFRVSGVSQLKIIGILSFFALCGIISVGFIGEQLVPVAEKLAKRIEYRDIQGNISKIGKYNVWLKLGNETVEFTEIMPDLKIRNIFRYKIIENQKLEYIKIALSGEYLGDGIWELKDISTTYFSPDHVKSTHVATEKWQTGISATLLEALIDQPEKMSITSLVQYIKHLKNHHQRTSNYEIELWKKVFYPFSVFVMVLIALCFIPVIHRYTGMGVRIFVGICLGIGFYLITRFFSFFGELLKMAPLWTALLPLFIFVFLTSLYLFYKEKNE